MLNDLCFSEALKAGKDLVSPMLSLQQRLINFLTETDVSPNIMRVYWKKLFFINLFNKPFGESEALGGYTDPSL